MKKQLEKIYLANVLLYFTNYNDLVTFGLINSKCFDALQILKHFPFNFKLQSSLENVYETKEIIKKTNYLLENIQTIQIPNELLLPFLQLDLNIEIELFTLTINYNKQKEIDKYKNITKIKIILDNSLIDIVDFTLFPKLKSLHIEDKSKEGNCIFILDTKQRYSLLRYNANEFDCNTFYQQIKQCYN